LALAEKIFEQGSRGGLGEWATHGVGGGLKRWAEGQEVISRTSEGELFFSYT